jgi:hypothetical protein
MMLAGQLYLGESRYEWTCSMMTCCNATVVGFGQSGRFYTGRWISSFRDLIVVFPEKLKRGFALVAAFPF